MSPEASLRASKPSEAPKAFRKETTPRESNGPERGVILYYTIKCVRTDVALFLCSSCYGMVETILVGVGSRPR